MKMNDAQIRELFHRNRPKISADPHFMDTLESRMDAVSEIKKINARTIARYKTIAILTFVAGLAAGASIFAYFRFRPLPAPRLEFVILPALAAFVEEWKYLLFFVIASSAITLGVFPWKRSRRL